MIVVVEYMMFCADISLVTGWWEEEE